MEILFVDEHLIDKTTLRQMADLLQKIEQACTESDRVKAVLDPDETLRFHATIVGRTDGGLKEATLRINFRKEVPNGPRIGCPLVVIDLLTGKTSELSLRTVNPHGCSDIERLGSEIVCVLLQMHNPLTGTDIIVL